MSLIGEPTLQALHDELKAKYAAPSAATIRSMLAPGSAGAGVGGIAGGLLGAGIGGARGFQKAREEGSGTGEAVLRGATEGLHGAGRGAVVGTIAGGLGGGAIGALSHEKGEAFRKALGALPGSHFGQRQLHNITGWRPPEGIGGIGLGAATKQPAVNAAKAALEKARAGGGSVGILDKMRGMGPEQAAKRDLVSARMGRMAAHRAEKMGLTNIPGYVGALREHGVGKTLGTAFKEQWHGTSPAMKALMVGAPAAELAGAVRSPDEADAAGKTKGQRIGGALARTASGAFLGPLSQTTQLLAGGALGRVGEAGGTMVDKIRNKPQGVVTTGRAPDLLSDSGQAVAGERIISDRAGGNMGMEGSPAW